MRKAIVAIVIACFAFSILGCCDQSEPELDYLDIYCSDIGDVSPIPEALDYFTQMAQDRLVEIPIKINPCILTALAQTVRYVDYSEVNIKVNPDWDNCYGASQYWEDTYGIRGEYFYDPVFSYEFKLDLMAHEYLHILEAESGIDIDQFYSEVQTWYNDLSWGEPTPDSNYAKYTLFWNLYSESGKEHYKEYYASSFMGTEEYAYIGGEIIDGKGYLIPDNILAYYDGIIDGGILWSK